MQLTRKLLLAVAILSTSLSANAAAQAATGRITGRVIDSRTAEGLPGVRVQVDGGQSALTTIEGRFTLNDILPGRQSLQASAIGFTPVRVTGVIVVADGVTEQTLAMTVATVELEELTVNAAAASGSVDALLDEQRHSVGIINAISAEQMSRSSDGDAAQAVQRVGGATVRDGKYVSVRGLGGRYTQTSLNGARIPSPEPEQKVVPLDLFPASLLSGIAASKAFTPDQPGDFAGASVNMTTRDVTGRRIRILSVSTGFSDALIGGLPGYAPMESGDWLALGAGNRGLPSSLANADFREMPSAAVTNSMVRSLRNTWSVENSGNAPNGSAGGTLGGSIPIGVNGVTYLVSGSWSASNEVRRDEVRAQAAPLSAGHAEEIDRFDGSTASRSVRWGGIANLATSLGSHSKLTLNNIYNRTMDNEGRRERGISENLALPLEIQRLRYVERTMAASQFEATHLLAGGNLGLEWGATLAGVSRDEPDRSEIVYSIDEAGVPTWFGFSNEAAVRTFSKLDETSVEAHADLRITLGNPLAGRLLKVGGRWRTVDREADNRVYSISLNRALPTGVDQLPPEQIFAEHTGEGDDYFRITPLGAGGSYSATDQLMAGYAMLLMPLHRDIDLLAGARLEHSRVEVSSLSTAGSPSLATPEFTDILPALTLTMRVDASHNLRLAASRTLARPEYRELSPILFREVIGGDNVRGNPDLTRTLISNLDLRWEWYPGRGEQLSAAVFTKHFDRPIERVYQGTSGTRIVTHVNAISARNVGIELEGRKSLSLISERLRNLMLFTNLTLMHSTVTLDPNSGAMTSDERRMVGQAPYVINAGVTWSHPVKEASATLLYNRVGERITEAGESPLPDVIEQPRDVLDFSLRLPVTGALSASMDVRNLLDSDHLVSQGGVVRERYRAGRVFSLGFAWSL